MNILLLLANPEPKSYNHVLAEAARETLEQLGNTVFFHDLYREHFDPVLPPNEATLPEPQLPQNIRDYLAELRTSDGIIAVHPNYWSSPPAILRGWIERVIRTNSCYNFTPQGPVSHIGGKIVQIFSTANTPDDVDATLYGDPVGVFWEKVVFGILGCKSYNRRNFSPVILSTAEERQQWLAEVKEIVRRQFTTNG
jgi:putative NADPH-quinone reductase